MMSPPAMFVLSLLCATPQSALEEARRLQREGKLEQAVAILEEGGGDDLESRSLLAWLYSQTARVDAAIESYRRLVEAHPHQVDLHNNLGALLFRERRLEEAEAAFTRAIASAPGAARPYFNLGLVHFEKGEVLTAVTHLKRACELAPENPAYFTSLARAHRAAFQFEPAAAAFRDALALDPPEPLAREARLELAMTLRLNGSYRKAGQELESWLASHPDDAEALFQMGRLHMAMNRYQDAEAAFDRVVDRNARHGPAFFMLGMSRYRLNRTDAALDAFRRLQTLEPHHAEASYQIGLILLQSGDEGRAREAFERALRDEPEHVGALYNLALLLRKLGEVESSREHLERFQELSRNRERLEFLEERVRLNPENARYHFELGSEYSRRNRFEDAVRSFQRALEIDPSLVEAEAAIADLLSRRRN